MNEKNELILFEKTIATREQIEKLLIEKDGLRPILRQVEELAKNFTYDLSNKQGREAVASQAYAVARSKTFFDTIRKELTKPYRDKVNNINEGWKEIEQFMDELKDEIRKPLTEIEEKEKAEKLKLETLEKNLAMVLVKYHAMSEIVSLEESLAKVNAVKIDDSLGEHEFKIHKAKTEATTHLEICIEARKKYDQEQAELKALREKEAQRIAKEAEETRIREAEARVKREAEEKANAEKEAIEKEKQDAIEREKKALKEKEEADLRAKEAEEKLKAQDEERARQEKIETEKKIAFEANEREIKKIVHNKILSSLIENGISEKDGKTIITLFAKNLIPHVSLSYSGVVVTNSISKNDSQVTESKEKVVKQKKEIKSVKDFSFKI